MYDAKKDETFSEKRLQFECVGDRSYYCMCQHNNMIDMKVSSVPIETITEEFK